MKNFDKDYHDAEIIGYVYKEKKQILKFFLDDDSILDFQDVVFFDFDNIGTQNVIFDIQTYHNQSCPEWLIESFPSISFYVEQRRHESYDFYYISSSVGLEAVIVCEDQAAQLV
ncbi:hypothetical protein [Neisseria sicca]|jgi:hypothetical protein|uniref:hypothetical protein n=1 Tax=Neisseria sicca TaxID=490 RepID=UPI000D2F7873|nr:hypothetical protein [Neisseria sicca]MBF1285458.1 hypothetical protein [Neisseria sp.]